MKPLLPAFCRPLGYVVLIISVFLPFLLVLSKVITDSNLLFYKESTKVVMMAGALMILLALHKNENEETNRIRIKAIRTAVFLTIIFLCGGMIYRTATGESLSSIDTSSFPIFLIINVICLEFGIKKAAIDKVFKR
jgi:heme/copper-type cytochrome/quinol oxidase subunit 4